jgi:hypothetical protein
MFKKQDQDGLANVYKLISEMHLNDPQAGSEINGKPVIVTMDLPGAEPDTEHGHEHDDSEIEMACAELHKVAEYAPKLKEMVSQMPGLEGWIAAKITKASDYISSVYHWLEYQQHEGKTECGCDSKEGSMYDAGYENNEECPYAAAGCTCGGCSDCH